jgi:hypothetical protein
VAYALKTLQSAADPDELLCSEAQTLTRAHLKQKNGKSVFLVNMVDAQLQDLIGDMYSFCSSFIDDNKE